MKLFCTVRSFTVMFGGKRDLLAELMFDTRDQEGLWLNAKRVLAQICWKNYSNRTKNCKIRDRKILEALLKSRYYCRGRCYRKLTRYLLTDQNQAFCGITPINTLCGET